MRKRERPPGTRQSTPINRRRNGARDATSEPVDATSRVGPYPPPNAGHPDDKEVIAAEWSRSPIFDGLA